MILHGRHLINQFGSLTLIRRATSYAAHRHFPHKRHTRTLFIVPFDQPDALELANYLFGRVCDREREIASRSERSKLTVDPNNLAHPDDAVRRMKEERAKIAKRRSIPIEHVNRWWIKDND